MDLVSISSFATAGGTLVLAVSTFSAVRSANRAARTSERALLANLRPVLVQSRLDDPPQKMRWVDDHWALVAGSRAVVERVGDNVYLAVSVRNVGSGIGVIHGWFLYDDVALGQEHADTGAFRMQSRDLYIPPDDAGFWQAAVRDIEDPQHAALVDIADQRRSFSVELLYGDHEGGQRTITRFGIFAAPTDDAGWMAAAARHWNLDRPDPR